MSVIEKIKNNLRETGVFIRVKKDGKFQAVDYLNLLPEQVQEKERWDNENWRKICDSVLAHIAGSTIKHGKLIDDRSIIIAILALLRELNIEAK